MTTLALALHAASKLAPRISLDRFQLASQRYGYPPRFEDEARFAIVAFGLEVTEVTLGAWSAWAVLELGGTRCGRYSSSSS